MRGDERFIHVMDGGVDVRRHGAGDASEGGAGTAVSAHAEKAFITLLRGVPAIDVYVEQPMSMQRPTHCYHDGDCE